MPAQSLRPKCFKLSILHVTHDCSVPGLEQVEDQSAETYYTVLSSKVVFNSHTISVSPGEELLLLLANNLLRPQMLPNLLACNRNGLEMEGAIR